MVRTIIKNINLGLSAALLRKARKLAEKKDMTLTGVIRYCINEICKQEGIS